MSIEIILGFLTGSLATQLVPKVLEMIQKSKEHKYSLEKIFFEKKLQAAEIGIAHWYGSGLIAKEMVRLLQLSASNEIVSQQIILEVQAELNNELKKIRQIQSNAHFSFPLYFEMDNSFLWGTEAFEKYLNSLSAAHIVGVEIDGLITRKEQGAIDSELDDRILELKKSLLNHCRDMNDAIESNIKSVNKLVTTARHDLKRYEHRSFWRSGFLKKST